MNNISHQFLKLLSNNTSIHEIVQYGAYVLKNPLMLLDATFNLVTYSGQEVKDDEIWNDFIEGSSRDKKYDDEDYSIKMMRQVMFEDQPIITNYHNKRRNRVVSKIMSSKKTMGYIVCLEYETVFPDNILELIDIVCNALAVELQRMNSYALSSEKMAENLLRELLENERGIERSSRVFLESVFGKDDEDYYIFVVPVINEKQTNERILYIRRQLETISAHSCSTYFEEKIVVLMTAHQKDLDVLWQRLTSILDVYKLKSGSSGPFKDIQQVYYHFQLALSTVETAQILDKKGISQFNDIALYDMIRHIHHDVDVHRYCPAALDILWQYDQKNETEYYQTLFQYICLSGNITMVAKEMYTHRNTIVYRLEKIKSLCQLDIDDGETRVKLYIGYIINHLCDF